MKKFLTLLLCAVSLTLLCACADAAPPPPQDDPPAAELPQESTQTPPPSSAETEVPAGPIVLDSLTFEVVTDWSDSNRLLSDLKDLPQLLKDCLAEQNCQVNEVRVTISTAGGLTADALDNGGIDLALMPAADFLSCNTDARALLTTDDTPCTVVLAVSAANGNLTETFDTALTAGLLETEAGNTFLNICRDGIALIPATDEAIQILRDHTAALEAAKGGA